MREGMKDGKDGKDDKKKTGKKKTKRPGGSRGGLACFHSKLS